MRQELNIRKLREDLGMTQSQLAAEIGVDQSTVSLWETTDTKPRGPALKLLAILEDRKPQRSAEVA